MTLDEAKKAAEAPLRPGVDDGPRVAMRVLADALRSAEDQVAAMREASAKLVRARIDKLDTKGHDARGEGKIEEARAAERAAYHLRMVEDEIRRLPAPAARTYEDGVRDAVKAATDVAVEFNGKAIHATGEAAREHDQRSEGASLAAERIEALLSPASAPPPGLIATPTVLPDGSRGWHVGLNGQEATYTDKDGAPHARIEPPPHPFEAYIQAGAEQAARLERVVGDAPRLGPATPDPVALTELLRRHAEVIAASATATTWVANRDLDGAAEWERKALAMLCEIDTVLDARKAGSGS